MRNLKNRRIFEKILWKKSQIPFTYMHTRNFKVHGAIEKFPVCFNFSPPLAFFLSGHCNKETGGINDSFDSYTSFHSCKRVSCHLLGRLARMIKNTSFSPFHTLQLSFFLNFTRAHQLETGRQENTYEFACQSVTHIDHKPST